MAHSTLPEPTERELQILRVLWERGEATVRQVHDALRDLGIVQNTVQAFLRTMTEKGLVAFRRKDRTFIYRPLVGASQTRRGLLDGVLRRAFDGALDQLVENAVALRAPTPQELDRLRQLIAELEARPQGTPAGGDGRPEERA
ncbi:MAG TPA: BlaI/MecI/CopY family transcriptional regulator [Planctomycetota bacterium]